jgi:hypothetical protein
VIGLRKKCGVEIDAHSSDILLRFLAQSMSNPELLRLLLSRLQRDIQSSASTRKLSHIECLAVTRLLLHVVGSGFLQCLFPLFSFENYLNTTPAKTTVVSGLFCLTVCVLTKFCVVTAERAILVRLAALRVHDRLQQVLGSPTHSCR